MASKSLFICDVDSLFTPVMNILPQNIIDKINNLSILSYLEKNLNSDNYLIEKFYYFLYLYFFPFNNCAHSNTFPYSNSNKNEEDNKENSPLLSFFRNSSNSLDNPILNREHFPLK
jgi:hypothetical protein